VKLDEFNDFPVGEVIMKLITLSNGKKYLYLHLAGDDDYGPYSLYIYENGMFTEAVNLIENQPSGYLPTVEVKKVSGNKIVFKNTYCTDVLGGIRYESTYQYKSGELKLTSKTYKLQGYGWGESGIATTTQMFSLTRTVKLYGTKTLKGNTISLKKGTKVKVTKIYISSKTVSYYLKAENGKSGWLKDCGNTNGTNYIIPEPCVYG
jgi:hypothetical protein